MNKRYYFISNGSIKVFYEIFLEEYKEISLRSNPAFKDAFIDSTIENKI